MLNGDATLEIDGAQMRHRHRTCRAINRNDDTTAINRLRVTT